MTRQVRVVPYDPAWPAEARAEAARLKAVLGEEAVAVHHFGSTAVPGLAAKPIIDLLVEVRDIDGIDAFNTALAALGYEARGENGIPGRRYFVRGSPDVHTHHVHMFQAGGMEVTRHLAVRDYLRARPAEAEAYARV